MKQSIAAGLLAFLLAFLSTSNISVLAHGGEDHGEKPAATSASSKGIITHTAKVGDLELSLKHPELAPDTASSGKLFLTDFRTNVPAEGATVTVEFEGSNGATTAAGIEPTAAAGVFSLRIPALPAGVYTVRAKIVTKQLTDTATFSGLQVTPHETDVAISASGWLWTLLTGALFFLVAGLFLLVAYLSLRTVIGRRSPSEAVSA